MTAPEGTELEVSLFGPGLGESVVLHLGRNEWVIVDSCRNQETGRPIALDYLQSIGVACETSVVAVVVTHWDSDHIRGIADVVAACPKAEIWCSAAIGDIEFDALLDLEKREPGTTGGRLRELMYLRQACAPDDGPDQCWALAKSSTRLVHRHAGNGLPARELWALSPSKSAVWTMLRRYGVRSMMTERRCRKAFQASPAMTRLSSCS